ncbi:SPASM domain-containing protein [Alphaproteobacteria bacterium]|nr:SPASM domain-containing protein [Alphaproteobacteria bacterium]
MSIKNIKTYENLKRATEHIDDVQIYQEKPLFSHLELNVTELCNRKCIFCPRVNEDDYPNQNLNINIKLIEKIADELKELNYKGEIVLSGFGEPTLNPNISQIISILSKSARVELVTNGDKLNSHKIREYVSSGLKFLAVSMYDGPEQIEKFKKIFRESNVGEDVFILRDRWHTEEDDFGLKLTNRAGTVNIGNQDPVNTKSPCYYPLYSMTIDWNGDVLLCVQDWNKKVKVGNLMFSSLYEIWHSSILEKRRRKLMNGNRCDSPCNKCNVEGTLHGFNHFKYWAK